MKLQYLGDARDAFKWDLLHWICTKSLPRFDQMVFVPLLTPVDIKRPDEGNTPHQWYECRPFIRPFVESLRDEPRSLNRIAVLGSVEESSPKFNVSVFSSSRLIGPGRHRGEYWDGFEPEALQNAVVFFDPDNGFETETRHGTKWIRHSELKGFLSKLPETSVAVVYQHRPRRQWVSVFDDLKKKLDYAHTAVAAYEGNLSFITLAGNASVGKRIAESIGSYSNNHRVVNSLVLRSKAR